MHNFFNRDVFKATCLIWLAVVLRVTTFARNWIVPLLFGALVISSARADDPADLPDDEELLILQHVYKEFEPYTDEWGHTYCLTVGFTFLPFKGDGYYYRYVVQDDGPPWQYLLDYRTFYDIWNEGGDPEMHAPQDTKIINYSYNQKSSCNDSDEIDRFKRQSEANRINFEQYAADAADVSQYFFTFKPRTVVVIDPEPVPLEIALTGPDSIPTAKRGDSDSFSLTLSVTNVGDKPLNNLENLGLFKSDIFAEESGEVESVGRLSPPLPSSLGAGETHIGTYVIDPTENGFVLLVAKVNAGDHKAASGVEIDIGELPVSDAELDTAIEGLWSQFVSELEASLKEYQLDVTAMVVASTLDTGANTAGSCGIDGQVTEIPQPNALEKALARNLGLPDKAFVWLPDDPVEAMGLYFDWVKGKAEGTTDALGEMSQPFAVAVNTYADMIANPDSRQRYVKELNAIVREGKGSIDGALQETYSFYSKDSALRAGAADVIKSSLQEIPQAIENRLKSKCEDVANRVTSRAEANGGDITSAFVQEMGSIYGNAETTILAGVALDVGTGSAFSALKTAGQSSSWINRVSNVLDRDLGKLPLGLSSDVNIKLPFKKTKSRKTRSTSLEVDGAFIPRKGSPDLPAPVPGAFDAELERILRAADIDSEDFIPPPNTKGGIHPDDISKIKTILKDLQEEYRAKGYDIDPEYSVRATNPLTAAKLRDANGNLLMTPKNELMKAKSITAEDIILGADPKYAGEVALYKPRLPDPDVWARFSPAERSSLQRRAKTQEKSFVEYQNTGSDFRKLIEEAKKPGGTIDKLSVPGGGVLDNGSVVIREVPLDVSIVETDSGMIRILDKANGNRPFGSDVDGHAIIDAATGQSLPSGIISQFELKFNRRLNKDGVAHGGHGWTKTAWDLDSELGPLRAQYLLENLPPDVARIQAAEFVAKHNKKVAAFNATAPIGKERKLLDLEDFLGKIEVGQKVIKITANNVTEGFGVNLVELSGSGAP